MNVNECGPDKSWRLVHDGETVMGLFESSGITTTIHALFEAATEEECRAEIARLGLVELILNSEGAQ